MPEKRLNFALRLWWPEFDLNFAAFRKALFELKFPAFRNEFASFRPLKFPAFRNDFASFRLLKFPAFRNGFASFRHLKFPAFRNLVSFNLLLNFAAFRPCRFCRNRLLEMRRQAEILEISTLLGLAGWDNNIMLLALATSDSCKA